MLSRYKIYRGKRPPGAQVPRGIKQDTRKHTKHCLRPPAELVVQYLADPSATAWSQFRASYLRCLGQRHKSDPTPFEELADLATESDVFLGCSCPTIKNPDVMRCHTVLALKFMKECYPELVVRFPESKPNP